MQTAVTDRIGRILDRAGVAARSSLRMIVAAYVAAAGTAVILMPGASLPLDALLGPELSQPITAAFLILAGGALLARVALRPAVLLLAFHMAWSAWLQVDPAGAATQPAGVWRDLALMGSLLLVLGTAPHRTGLLAPLGVPGASAATFRRARRTPRPGPDQAARQLTREEILAAPAPALPDPRSRTDRNLFADIWDSEETA